ncbi:response receiver sensor histidine kinase, PAS domain-containing [Citrifermentans bemidjiense Bem]|uniref:histidine kinase n=1 Tax=Citrifermentans bemidjiense (strain ATCC BAA-1014 / DSM 16622 / JCM 12645 / Bem) TaxID=404380 RepID=B5E7Q5_CITBB|nr:response regulator [Citrifermentans bemidjiense]ACH37041.1 response receiver sensor histidine kinase, PAS domain-containing [Citrifermentans bemidjiense Bem]
MQKDKILIVDDEADIALILKLQLEDAGYETVRARDGVEALEAVAQEPFDLIMLDIKMPRMDGLEVLSRLKGDETPVVMMTAHGSEDIAVDAMKKGALDYISKPFSTDDMLQKVERAIGIDRTRKENARLSQQLDEERRKMEAVLQGMADLLVAVDLQGRIITWSRQAARLLAAEGESLLGKTLEEVLKAEVPGGELPARTVLRTGEPRLDVGYLLKIGSLTVPVLSSAAPLWNANGELAGSVEIIRDISKLKELEQEKEDFVSMLSHDLKSPITAVVGSIDLVREAKLGPVTPDQSEYLNAAIESCEEMVEMIDTLLGIHKFEAGKMKLNFREEDPSLLINRSVTKFQTPAQRGAISLFATLPPSLPAISADRSSFSRILGNLLSNAVKFTPEGGEIEVSADLVQDPAPVLAHVPEECYPGQELPREGEFVRIRVRDSGVGIPQESLGSIFDRFVQARNRRQGKTRGTGLGLAFCRKAVDAHGGYIWAESEPGAGSVFTLMFPALPEEEDE